MGLIGISSPQHIDIPGDTDLINNCFVIVATTTEERIKVIYHFTDTGPAIKELLEENGVSESTALAIVKSANKQILIDVNGDSPPLMAKKLPGVMKLKAKHPVSGIEDLLYTIVINLNDQHHWKREDIADWIENTFDTKEIAFHPPEEVSSEKRVLSKFTKVVTVKRVL